MKRNVIFSTIFLFLSLFTLKIVYAQNSPYLEKVPHFTNLVNSAGASAALTELRSESTAGKLSAEDCHDLAHIVGHTAFKKYGDFGKAMTYQDELCNAGYIHGVIEEYFTDNKNVFAAMQTVCDIYPAGKFTSWECYHGVGHGLMYYTNNNLPKALDLCSNYAPGFARASCINGVYMENFTAGKQIHPSTFLRDNDLFYPCTDKNFGNKNDCYVYAPIRYLNVHPKDYTGALDFCQNAPLSYRSTCTEGVGSQMMKENIDNPPKVESLCKQGKFSQIMPCIDGMVGLYINHLGSITQAEGLCRELAWPDQRFCKRTIQNEASLF